MPDDETLVDDCLVLTSLPEPTTEPLDGSPTRRLASNDLRPLVAETLRADSTQFRAEIASLERRLAEIREDRRFLREQLVEIDALCDFDRGIFNPVGKVRALVRKLREKERR